VAVVVEHLLSIHEVLSSKPSTAKKKKKKERNLKHFLSISLDENMGYNNLTGVQEEDLSIPPLKHSS
jgi:hypothetical protein